MPPCLLRSAVRWPQVPRIPTRGGFSWLGRRPAVVRLLGHHPTLCKQRI